VLVRVLAVAGLGISAYVHLHLASSYPVGDTITQTDLFYAQGAVAIVIGLWLLVTGHRLAWLAAALVAAASLGAVLLYRYVDVGSIGPIPNMYEPVWFTEKTTSAIAEGATVVLWLAHEASRLTRRR